MNIKKIAENIIKNVVDMEVEEVETYTGYEKLKHAFNYKGIRIGSYDVEQGGNDFDGFEAEITGILSNSLEFSYSHDEKGRGEFKVRTRKKTEFLKKEFDLQEIGGGYHEVLYSFLKSVLDFNF